MRKLFLLLTFCMILPVCCSCGTAVEMENSETETVSTSQDGFINAYDALYSILGDEDHSLRKGSYIGTAFQIAQVSPDGNVTALEHVTYCPVIHEERIIGFVTAFENAGGISYSSSPLFAEKLNAALEQSPEILCFCDEEDNIFLLDKSGTVTNAYQNGIAAPEGLTWDSCKDCSTILTKETLLQPS